MDYGRTSKSADYWVNHLRHVVKFSEGIKHLLSDRENVFVEVGPGRTLSSFVRQHTQGESSCPIVNTVRHPKEKLVMTSTYFKVLVSCIFMA